MAHILAVDTTTAHASVAIASGEKLFEAEVNSGAKHGEFLLDLVKQCLQAAELDMADLDAISFGQGPGSFTGLRIACGVAQGLAFAHDLPVIAVNSLEALAYGGWREWQHRTAASTDPLVVLATIDARMDEVYFAAFEMTEQATQILIPSIVGRPESILSAIPAEGLRQSGDSADVFSGLLDRYKHWIGVGSGWQFQPRFTQLIDFPLQAIDPNAVPRARDIVAIARRRFEANQVVFAAQAQPLYIRNKVAHT